MSKTLILLGAVLMVIGFILEYALFLLNGFGNLPGDMAKAP